MNGMVGNNSSKAIHKIKWELLKYNFRIKGYILLSYVIFPPTPKTYYSLLHENFQFPSTKVDCLTTG